MGRTVPILGAGRRSRGICDRNALTCTGYSIDCFWHVPRSFGSDLGVVRRVAERERRIRAFPRSLSATIALVLVSLQIMPDLVVAHFNFSFLRETIRMQRSTRGVVDVNRKEGDCYG